MTMLVQKALDSFSALLCMQACQHCTLGILIGQGSTFFPLQVFPHLLAHPPTLFSSIVGTMWCLQYSTWQSPQDDGGAPVDNYTITVSPGSTQLTTVSTSALLPAVPYNVVNTVSIVTTNCNGSSSSVMETIRISYVVAVLIVDIVHVCIHNYGYNTPIGT